MVAEPLPEDERWEEQRLFDIANMAAGPGGINTRGEDVSAAWRISGRGLLTRCWANSGLVGQCASTPVNDLGLCAEHREQLLSERDV